ETRMDIPTPRRGLEHLRRYAFGLELACHRTRGRGFAAGRVLRVDPDEIGEVSGGLFTETLPVEIGARQRTRDQKQRHDTEREPGKRENPFLQRLPGY